MGSGRDKRKKAAIKTGAAVVGRGAEKTEKKTQRNEEKAARRMEKAGGEDDIDKLLAQFALKDKSSKEVTVEESCEPPSARVNASFTPYIAPSVNELIMFGGECVHLETGKVKVFNDLYRFNTDKQRWTRIIAPGSPTPRCAHQAVVYKGSLYVFGGEFSSPSGEKFRHFRDLWRLNLSSHEWDQLPSKGGPTARSGHRMALYKNKAILFGGFNDAGQEIKYYNDLWELDLATAAWTPVGNPNAAGPSPRSGCQLAVHGDVLFLYGGYSRSVDEDDPELEHGKAHDDMWALDLTTYMWERVKKAGMAPGPRSSFGMVPHKGRAFLFGGVSDNEARGGEDLSSEFHNDLYTFSLDKRRWFAAELRPSKASKSQQEQQQQQQQQPPADSGQAGGGDQPSTSGTRSTEGTTAMSPELAAMVAAGTDKNSVLYKAAVRIQSRFRGYVVRKAYKVYKLGGVVSEILYSPAEFGLDCSVLNQPKPRARINAQLAMVGNHLWLFGGTVEVGSRDITLDDMWRLDLNKLDGWQLVKENTVGEEVFKAGQSSDEWESDEEGA